MIREIGRKPKHLRTFDRVSYDSSGDTSGGTIVRYHELRCSGVRDGEQGYGWIAL